MERLMFSSIFKPKRAGLVDGAVVQVLQSMPFRYPAISAEANAARSLKQFEEQVTRIEKQLPSFPRALRAWYLMILATAILQNFESIDAEQNGGKS